MDAIVFSIIFHIMLLYNIRVFCRIYRADSHLKLEPFKLQSSPMSATFNGAFLHQILSLGSFN